MPRTALRFSIAACLFAIACETPVVTPVEVRPITPRSGEEVVTDQSVLIVDNSGSISRTGQFPHDKALTQSLVAAMPDGSYQAGAIAFGGFDREVQPLAAFDRAALSAWASKQTYLKGGTPTSCCGSQPRARRQARQCRHHVVTTVCPVRRRRQEQSSGGTCEETRAVCIHTIQVAQRVGTG